MPKNIRNNGCKWFSFKIRHKHVHVFWSKVEKDLNMYMYFSTMIWMDSGSMTIEQSSLDGTDRKVLLKLTTSNVSGLSLDHTNRKWLYWCERESRRIVRLNIETRDNETVSNSADCYSLTVFKTKMYWIDMWVFLNTDKVWMRIHVHVQLLALHT